MEDFDTGNKKQRKQREISEDEYSDVVSGVWSDVDIDPEEVQEEA